MGRRAADLTTSVPLLGVPALVGAHCWRTTVAESSGGALLPTCGPQSSVGVQTSPGISSLPIQKAAELAGALSTPLGKVTPVGYISKETEYREVTKCDKENRAILKLKSGESKTKKEVTFKTLYCEASKDTTRVRKSVNGTYCYAKAVKSNPIFACKDNGVRLKPRAVRYTNGSVVDSDAIGGISVESAEADAVKTSTSHDKSQTTLGFYEDNTEKTLLVSAGRPLQMPKKICSHCGGRQSVIAVGEETSYSFDTCLGKKAKFETNIQSSCHNILERSTCGDKKLPASDNLKLLFHNGDIKHRGTPHPACPVHSRSHLVPLLLKKGVNDAQLYSRAVTITKATIETRQEDAGAKKSTLQSTPGTSVPRPTSLSRPTSLPLTPYVATTTEPSKICSHIQTKLLQQNLSQSVCVSVHAVPEKTLPLPSVYTSAGGHQNTSVTEMHLKRALLPSNPVGARHEVQSLNPMACRNAGKHLPCKPPKTATCSSVSLVDNPSHLSHPLKTATQPASHPSTPSTQGQKQSSHTDMGQTVAFPHAVFYTPGHVQRALRPPASTTTPRKPVHHSSIQMVLTPTRHSCTAAPNLSIRPKYSSSEPLLHVTPPPQKQIPDATSLRDLKVGLFSAVAPISASMYRSILCKNRALRNSSANVKNSPPTAATFSLAPMESPQSITISGTISFHPSDEVQHSPRLIGSDTNQLGRTTVSGSSGKNRDKFALYGMVSNAHSNSTRTTAVVSETTGLSRQGSPAISKPDKFITNLIHKLEVCEKRSHEDSHHLQMNGNHTAIPFLQSKASCLQGFADIPQSQPQQPPVHCQGHREKERESHRNANRLVQTLHGQDLTYKSVAGVTLIGHADVGDKQRTGNEQETVHKIAPGAGLSSQNTRQQEADATRGTFTCKMPGLDILSAPKAHAGLPPPPRFDSKAELCMHPSLKSNSARPSSALCLPSDPQTRPCHEVSVVRPQSRPGPEDSDAAHSHPAHAALLLPPSPQCCESASLQQRLETVEASLAANKDRITTLLNIIYDLETCQSTSSGRYSYKTGQDLKNCETCQKTACVVYSVEYDFRQQEKLFLEVLNRSTNVDHPHHLNFTLFRRAILKKVSKSKVKSKKLCKTLFKWLPRKTQHAYDV